jgi:hypothetical protein
VLDPNKEGDQWINPCFGLKAGAYTGKFKAVNGPDSDPLSQDIDPEIAVLAGEGLRNGRLLISDGSIPKKNIPKLATIHARRTSSKPGIERRPRPAMDLIQQFEVCPCSFLFLLIACLHCNDDEPLAMAYCRPA